MTTGDIVIVGGGHGFRRADHGRGAASVFYGRLGLRRRVMSEASAGGKG